jgi:DNA-directed RNA polymerase subunit RPC12/RpoP
MIAEISSHAFDSFFAWAPWVVGFVIYFIFWVAKRHEVATVPASPIATATYACASCGRRGTLDQMIVQHHGGAVGYQCPNCASAQATAH